MATRAQIEIYQLHKDTCIANGIGQTQIYHRAAEGTVSTVAGTNNMDYTPPDPRTADFPTQSTYNVWMTWEVKRLMGLSTDAGDESAARAWMFRDRGQCPAIDDNGNQILIQDEDLGLNPQGWKFRIENPALDPDNGTWAFEMVRVR